MTSKSTAGRQVVKGGEGAGGTFNCDRQTVEQININKPTKAHTRTRTHTHSHRHTVTHTHTHTQSHTNTHT